MKAQSPIFNSQHPIINVQVREETPSPGCLRSSLGHWILDIGYWILGFLPSLPLLAAFAVRLPAGEAPAEDPVARLLEQARAWSSDSRKQTEVLHACEEAATSPLAKKEQKVEALGIMADAFRTRRKFPELIQTLDRIRSAFPGDKDLACKALLGQLAAYWEWGKTKEGVEKAGELVQKSAGDTPAEAAGRLWLARFLRRTAVAGRPQLLGLGS